MIKRPLSKIKKLYIHCSDFDGGHDIEDVRDWHKAKGWDDVGYNWFSRFDGLVQVGRPIDYIPAQAKGFNSDALAFCFAGVGEPNQAQNMSFKEFLWDLKPKFPHLTLHRHCAVDYGKTCPSFDILEFERYWYVDLKSRARS